MFLCFHKNEDFSKLFMNDKIIFLKPYISETIWGGTKLKEYGYDCPYKTNGEAWIISAIENKSSIICDNEKWNGTNLLDFYNQNKSFFNNYEKPYPLLTKIIDANDDLSVQVHPDDNYAKQKHNKYGKAECWYVLDCEDKGTLVYGHNAKNLDQLKTMIEQNEWDKLLIQKPIHKGDVVYVPPGTVHAIKKNTLIFEVQQSSDITYRLYDYNRKDVKGQTRELHLQDSMNVIYYPQDNLKSVDSNSKYLVNNQYFTLLKISNSSKTKYFYPEAQWVQATVINGKGTINNKAIQKGSSFLVAHNTEFELDGNLEILISYV